MALRDRWLERTWHDPIARELAVVLTCPTGRTSAGWPYLERHAWVRFRDWVPHILGAGARVLATVDALLAEATPDERASVTAAVEVVRQIVRTAQITAPPDLWLLRQVLSSHVRVGLRDRWAAGDVVRPTPALEPDLALLLSRGYLVRSGDGYRWAEGPVARSVLGLPPVEGATAHAWTAAFAGDAEAPRVRPRLPGGHAAPAWIATPADLDLGVQLVPVVLGLRASRRIDLPRGRVDLSGPAGDAAGMVLRDAAVIGEDGAITPTGRRVLERGPGPFGILEAYHPYLGALDRILADGPVQVRVARGPNVAASRDANTGAFHHAQDALDAFCAATGFGYTVFVEHAVGQGEALRQRWARSGDTVAYVGADLEDEALAAARAEQAAGRLPPGTVFVQADIGRPDVLVHALTAHGITTEGAVMIVGNGFHEVRGADDARMVEVFRGYARAGFVLLFTEESALATDDLLATAWNTYHAGFRYVHQRSGQGLRPAQATPPSRLGAALPTSWAECAAAAGYHRADRFCRRSRTIYPYPPANGVNPSISVNHFLVPTRLANALGLR